MSYAPHHGPGFGHVPPQMKVDTSRSPVNYQSFPCYGSYGYPYPLPYHGCYHHNQIPDYHSYGLHYPHYAPPAPVYCHGSYPPHPESYPFQYLPSPHYSAMDPRYEYDKKGLGDHHCCGCPNHFFQQKENKNVKIEEQTPDDEQDRVASLVPSELKDLSYPLLWIPPGYKSNEEGAQTIKSESKGEENSFNKEANGSLKPSAQDPSVWNGWLPINLNNLNSLIKGRDEKGTGSQQPDDSKSLFPVGWMPHNPKQKEKMELKDGDQKSDGDPSQFRMFPLKFLENQDKKSMAKGDTQNDNSSPEDGPKTGDKNVVKKIIPVKQLDQTEEKGPLEDVRELIPVKQMNQTEEYRATKVEKKPSEMPLKHADKKGEKKHLENNSNGQSSLSKASKLPPVCLRVDPLPSRRTKSGSSRSPSPPANKGKSERLSHEKSSSSSIMQGNTQQDMQSSADSDRGRVQSKNKVQNIEVGDSTMGDDERADRKEVPSQSPVNVLAGDSQEKVPTSCQAGKGDQDCAVGDKGVENVDKLSGEVTKDEKLTIDGQSGDGKCETRAKGGPIDTKESELQCTNGANEAPDQKFSEAEAAAIIQSAYRGFEVRRWEPLKKLKEIARIKGELMKVRIDVQNLVSSGSGSNDKQRIVIGETIMNLLLQLDTLQGLHPSVRNIRKSVAKELVGLQEELDSLTFHQNSDELQESGESKHAEEISKSAADEGREQAAEDRHEQDITSAGDMRSDVMELCQDQPHTVTDVNISSVDVEDSELILGTDEMGGASKEKELDSLGYTDLNKWHPEQLTEVKEPSEMHGVCEDHDSLRVESKELPPPIVSEEKLNRAVQLQNLSSLADPDWTSKYEVTEVNIEVPPRVSEQDSDARVFGEGLQINGGRCIVEPGELELVLESGLVSLGNEAKETRAEEQRPKRLLTESPDLSDLKDNIATGGYLKGSSEQKENVSVEGDSERDKELGGEDMLGAELMGASQAEDVSSIKEAANVCVVEGDKSVDDMWTAVGVATKETPNIKEVANFYEVEGEGDDKPVDDMRTAVGVQKKETPDAKEAENVCKVEGVCKPVDDMQTADTVGLEKKETPEVNEVGRGVGPVEVIESIETSGPEVKDLSLATLGSEVTQQKPFVKDTVSDEEVPMEESANCNMEPKMSVDEDLEMWEDKFDNKEISLKCSSGNIVDLPREGDLVGEELVTKQPHKEFPAGEGDLAGEELVTEHLHKKVPAPSPILDQISSGTGTESDKKLVEENERLKETVEKLIAAGKEQLSAISSLSGRVKELEKKLSRKKKLKMRRHNALGQYLLHV